MRYWALLLIALLASACGNHVPPNASPELRISIYANDAMRGVREIQQLTIKLEAGGIIRTSDAAKIMVTAEKVGKGGQALSAALAVYHAAKTLAERKSSLAEVMKILDDIDANLKVLLAPLDEKNEKLKYLDLVTSVVKGLWSVRTALPSGGVA